MVGGRLRGDVELEADRLFLLGLLQKGGTEISATQAAKILNDRRRAAAHDTALALGKTEQEAEAAGAAATLSVQSVRRDVRIVLERLRDGSAAVSAVFIDDQITEVRVDLEATYRIDDEVWRDLERSRRLAWSRTTGRSSGSGPDAKVIPEKLVRYAQDVAADAALYGVLQRNFRHRSDLRRELRALRYGRQWFPSRGEEETFAQALTDLSDPAKARGAALALYARELETLYRAEALEIGAGSPELLAMERMRVQKLHTRARMIREYLPLVDEEGRAEGRGYELVVKRVGPGAPAEEPESGSSR